MFLKKTVNFWLPILFLLVLVGLTLLNLQLSSQFRYTDDFAPRWMAARMWMREGSSPYSEKVYQATQTLLIEHGFTPEPFSGGHFLDPVFYLFFYIPLSFLDFSIARAIWMTLIEVSYILGALLALKVAGLKLPWFGALLVAIVALLFYPAFKLVITASILPPFIFLVLWACSLAIDGHGNGAGILLFISLAMVPLSLFVAIFFMIWMGSHRDNSLVKVYFFGIIFLIISSMILFPAWISDWFAHLITLHPNLGWVDTPLMRIGAFFPGAIRAISIILHLALAFVLFVEWYALPVGDERVLLWKLMLTLNLLYFFNPTSQAAYLMLVFPSLFLIFKFLAEKWRRNGKILGWILYLALAYFYWTRFSVSQNWQPEESSSVILILPILTIIGLQWFRWWATASPKALIESS